MEQVWLETKRVLAPGGRFALNIAPTSIKAFRPIHHDFANQLRAMGMIMRTEIVWYKQTMKRRTAWGSWKSPSNPHIVPSWEYVLVFSKDKWQLSGKSEDADITSDEFLRFSDGFWYIPPEPQRRGHPAPFPEELIYRLVKYYTYKGNTVLDMFGGTGTVAVVCQKNNRNFIHIDISPQYCETARQRVEVAKVVIELPVGIGKPGKYKSARELRNGTNAASKSLNGPAVNGHRAKVPAQNKLLERPAEYTAKSVDE
jgi:site-specific DNA-methyltransferase (adenine-specific)